MNKAKITLLLIFISIVSFSLSAQVFSVIDASHLASFKPIPIPMKGENPQGVALSVNSRYFEKNGKPWFPVMGEMHYNRVRPQDWEDEILKMKSGGLSIIASYVFWNEHETAKGVWDWEDNRNLRKFVGLCGKHGMYVWLRIGPWCHGEQLHGGHPDWINTMKGKRSNDPEYIAESKKLFEQIGKQTKGLYFKDGGPVIGVQLENEYASGEAAHISILKNLALGADITPVYWTVTANTVFDDVKMEVIPLQGSYPYRGWEKAGGKATKDFLYGNDQWIMTDALGKLYYDINKFPRGLCEQGCGSQMTYENRFIVEPHIIEAHLQNQIGRGMNLAGYYMFHGGTQCPGLKEPGYSESYDFQAPISEFGFLRPSFKYLKILHNFINDFGSDLAQMQVVEPANPVRNELDTENLRYIARVKGNSGFLFLCNAQVRVNMPDKPVKINVKVPGETIEFPEFVLKGQTSPILPFNLDVNGVQIKYATAQPFAKIENNGNTEVFFQILPSVNPQLAIEANNIKEIKASGWLITKLNSRYLLEAQTGNRIHITKTDGKTVTLVFVSRTEAENAWQVNIHGTQSLLITDADVLVRENTIELLQLANPIFNLKIYPAKSMNFSQIANKKENEGYSTIMTKVNKTFPECTQIKKNASTVELKIPSSLPSYISDIFAKVDYYGGQVEITQNGKIQTDHLYNGTSWLPGLKRFIGTGSITFQAKEWNDGITGVAEEKVQHIKDAGTSMNTIELLPQYKIILGIK